MENQHEKSSGPPTKRSEPLYPKLSESRNKAFWEDFKQGVSESILCGLAQHAAEEIYRRSRVVGSLKRVPQDFRDRAQEAAEKGYSLKLLREMSQREAATAVQERCSEAQV